MSGVWLAILMTDQGVAMFFRTKSAGKRRYLQIVENARENGRVKQRVLANVGRMDELAENGRLEALLSSGARFSEQIMMLSALEDSDVRASARRIGGPLVFGRVWSELGVPTVLHELLSDRHFAFPVERAVFATVLHRMFVSGSDRACERWLRDYAIDGAEGLQLQHLYRAMAWLGEELPETEQEDATGFAPRCIKDVIEEKLFQRRRDLLSDLSLVFLDTTSISFHGEGGETLGAHGHSKDKRPDLKQMILGLVVDGDGRPVCTEMWPGNTADGGALLPIVDRLRSRFSIGRVCLVADKGMISRATVAGLEDRGLEYVLGARERSTGEVRDIVLNDAQPYLPLAIERQGGETQLFVKDVTVDGRRYVVCYNEEEAARERETRQAVIESLQEQLRRGDKAVVGNSAYRKYLRTTDREQKAFEIDSGKLAEEAAFDGVFVLRTNADVSAIQAVLRYRDLLRVEDLFRRAKAAMQTRPIYHQTDAAIRGHVFCSFLALILQKEMDDRCQQIGERPEWEAALQALDGVQQVDIERDGKRWRLRTEADGQAQTMARAAGVGLPPRTQALTPEAA
jgi:hypothetical protein